MRLGCVVCAMEEGGRGRGTREGSPPQNPPPPFLFSSSSVSVTFLPPGVAGKEGGGGEPGREGRALKTSFCDLS